MSTEKILSGVKVLVADDSNTIRRSADIFLRKAVAKSFTAKTVSMHSPRYRTLNPISFSWM